MIMYVDNDYTVNKLDHLGVIYVCWYGKVCMYILSENKLENTLITLSLCLSVYVQHLQIHVQICKHTHVYVYIHLTHINVATYT